MNSRQTSLLAVAALAFAGSLSCATAADDTTAIFSRFTKITNQVELEGGEIFFAKINYVARDGSSSFSATFEEGKSYSVFALGDEERVTDVDLVVADDKEAEVGHDDTDSNTANVSFTPKATGVFSLTIKAGQMRKGFPDGLVGLIVARTSVDKSTARSAKTIGKYLSDRVVTSSMPNNDIFVCQIDTLERGNGTTLTYRFRDDMDYTVIAMGDGNSVIDLDLKAVNEEGKVIAADEQESNTGIVKFSLTKAERIKLTSTAGVMKKGVQSGYFGLIIMMAPKAQPQSLSSR